MTISDQFLKGVQICSSPYIQQYLFEIFSRKFALFTALQKSSQELRTVHLPVVSNSICHALYRNQANITIKQMCAGGEIGFDACSGDSGGPLLKVEAYNGGPRCAFIWFSLLVTFSMSFICQLQLLFLS